MFVVAPISSRNQFGRLLAGRGLVTAAAEVGTHRGELAAVLLADWPGTLSCVDPWGVPPGYEAQAGHLPETFGADRDADLAEARRRLAAHGARVRYVRGLSPAAADAFADGSLDFVYVDGDHSYEAVLADLSAWWPKVRPGGLLAGHDLVCPGEEAGGWGRWVQPALCGFLRAAGLEGLPVHLVVEEGGLPWSFYLERP